jgi:hypothetical protein
MVNRKKRYSSTLSLTSELDRVAGQRHALAALHPGKTRYPLYGRLGGPRPGLDRCENLAPTRRASKLERGSNFNNCLSLLPNHPVRLWGPATHPTVQWGRRDPFLGLSSRTVKLANPLNLMSGLRISGSYTSVPPVCLCSAWRDNRTAISNLKFCRLTNPEKYAAFYGTYKLKQQVGDRANFPISIHLVVVTSGLESLLFMVLYYRPKHSYRRFREACFLHIQCSSALWLLW